MPIPEKTESGEISGQLNLQQQSAVQPPSAIPIKKRKFPVIHPASPSSNEKASSSNDNDSKNGQELGILPDGKQSSSNVKSVTSLGNSDVIKTSVLVVKKEAIPMNMELGQPILKILPSEPQEVKPLVGLGSVDDSRNKQDGSSVGKDIDRRVLTSSLSAQTVSVKQEIVNEHVGDPLRPRVSMTSVNVELSLGRKEPAFLARSEKLNNHLVRLALSKGKFALHGRNITPIGSASSGVDANRSNWDLNTTMDTWEGSTVGKINDSLAMPFKESNGLKENQLVDKPVLTSTSSQVNMQPLNKSVKIESMDENLKCNTGGCSSNNKGLPQTNSVKKELVNNLNTDNILPSLTSHEKLVDHSFIKSEVVEGIKEAKNHSDAKLPQSFARVIQNQEDSTSRNDRLDDMISNPVGEIDSRTMSSNVRNSNLEALGKCKSALVDENTLELGHPSDLVANNEVKINIPTEIHEKDPFGSDSESQEMDIDEENVGTEGYEKREGVMVQGPLQNSMEKNPVVDREKSGNSEIVSRNSQNSQFPVPSGGKNINSQNSQFPVPSGGKNINMFNFEEKIYAKKNCDGTDSNMVKDHVGISPVPNDGNKIPDGMRIYGKKFIGTVSGKQLGASWKRVDKRVGNEVYSNTPVEGNHGMKVALSGKVMKEVCLGENDSTLPKEDTSFDVAKDSSNIDKKGYIINLPRASVAETSSETRPIPNWLLNSHNRNESFPSLDEDIQPQENRDKFFFGGAKKFGKARIPDRSLRNSYMRGRGRISGRFGLPRREWDSNRDLVFTNGRGPSNNRAIRHKHASSISNVDAACNDQGDIQNSFAFRGGRRKQINGGHPSMRRRITSRDGSDGMDTRGVQMLRGIPNMSPDLFVDEDCFDMLGKPEGNEFIPCSSDDMFDPIHNCQQAMYDEVDTQFMRGRRNFSSLHGNGFPRPRSKSPVGPQVRLPRPWLSPQQQSPNGPAQTQYRRGRMRSPNFACFPNDTTGRPHGSPPYPPTRHYFDPRDVHPNREYVRLRSTNSHRRNSPSRAFQRNATREDMLDPRVTREGNTEYVDETGVMDDRRNFNHRLGPPVRPFHPMYENDSQFYRNDHPEPRRFYTGLDNEFVESSNVRGGGEFFEQLKHHQTGMEQRAWHDDGYIDNRMKRTRF